MLDIAEIAHADPHPCLVGYGRNRRFRALFLTVRGTRAANTGTIASRLFCRPMPNIGDSLQGYLGDVDERASDGDSLHHPAGTAVEFAAKA
jgi:hypothetical protein